MANTIPSAHERVPKDGITIPDVYVHHTFVVIWSNGCGESVYKVLDDPGQGHHMFSLVSEKEYV